MAFFDRIFGNRNKTGGFDNDKYGNDNGKNDYIARLIQCGELIDSLSHSDHYVARSEYADRMNLFSKDVEYFRVLENSGMLEAFCKRNEVSSDEVISIINRYDIKNGLDKIFEYGIYRELSYDTIKASVDWLISKHYILQTKGKYPVLHPTYEGLHYSESITVGNLNKLKKYLETEVITWNS